MLHVRCSWQAWAVQHLASKYSHLCTIDHSLSAHWAFVWGVKGRQDKARLLDVIRNEPKWISRTEGARDPLAFIGEARYAINM